MSAGFFIMKLEFTIDADQENTRLDTIISKAVPSCSRSRAARLITDHSIRVGKLYKKPGYRVKSGDQIIGILPREAADSDILPEPIEFEIIYEDAHLLVVNKAPGMVVHPAPGNVSGTLVNALLSYFPQVVRSCKDRFRSGIVHRLDKDTSGLIVVAKTRQALEFLQKEFKQRRVKKKYLALVHGRVMEDSGQIDLPIGRHPVKRKKMAIRPEQGKPALSLWSVKKRFDSASLVEVILKTGRTHQIRVHFYAIGHPLIGETTYRPRRFRKKKQMAPRQMLHSFFIGFRHPYSGKRMEFEIGLPNDFNTVQNRLF